MTRGHLDMKGWTLSRRQFLRLTGVTAGATLLAAACPSPAGQTNKPPPPPPPGRGPADPTPAPRAGAAAPTPAAPARAGGRGRFLGGRGGGVLKPP
nr:twin-arginine translocation signal domain-containing protein [Ardenticatenia bacterium]